MLFRPYSDPGADSFDAFWRACPRRQGGKLEAEKEYRKALVYASPMDLLAGMERYAAYVRAHDTPEQFVVTPAVWLRRGMWADEYELPAEKPAPFDWYRECALLHQGQCGGQFQHHLTMQRERYRKDTA